MKYLYYYLTSGLFVLFTTTAVNAQFGFFVTGGSVVTNQTQITVRDGDVEVTDGRILGGTLRMTGFTGQDNNRLINNDQIRVDQLRLENGARISFEGGVRISDILWIDSDASLDLLDATIVLTDDAFLDGAANNISSSVPGTFILHYEDHNPDAPGLLGNLGIRMEPSRENLGLVDLYRHYGGVSVNGAPTLARYYEINPNNQDIAEFEMGFRLPDTELEGIPRDDIRLYNSTDSGATWTEVDAEDRFENFNAEVVPLGLFAFANATVLPVELLSFTAVAAGKKTVDCHWQTASEGGGSHFEVERSADGDVFAQVGQVTASGDSQTTRDYRFRDADALTGASFYRLRMVDLDGSFTYSQVVTVMLAEPTSAVLYPNPTQAVVRLELPEGHTYTQYTLYTTDGRKLLQGIPGVGTSAINVVDLPAGFYHLVLEGGEQPVTLPLHKR